MPNHSRRVASRVAAVIVAAATIASCSSPPPAPRSITLTFVRHAESEGNTSPFIDTTVPGPGLTPEGRQQALHVADELRGNDYDGIYASTMVRSQQTAAPLAGDLGEQVEVLPGLREIAAGRFEGKPVDAIASTYFLAPMEWLQGDRAATIPGSLNGNQFNDQFSAAVQKIYDSGETRPVAFSHGASIMVWTLMNVANSKSSLLATHPLPNASRVVITGNPSHGWRLVDWDGIKDF